MNAVKFRIYSLCALLALFTWPLLHPRSPWGEFHELLTNRVVDAFISRQTVPPEGRVVVIDMDERSANLHHRYNYGSAYDRITGDLLDILSNSDPAAVGMLWPGVAFRAGYFPTPGSRLLARTAVLTNDTAPVSPGFKVVQDEELGVKPIPIYPRRPEFFPKLGETPRGAIRKFRPDADGVVRRIETGDLSDEILKILNLPSAAGRIRFLGPYRTIRTYPLWRVICGEIPPSEWNGKVVIGGSTTSYVSQVSMTPVGALSDAEIVAQAVEAALQNLQMASLGAPTSMGLMGFLFIAVLGAGYVRVFALRFAMMGIIAAIFTGIHYLLLIRAQIPPISASAGFFLCGCIVHVASYLIEQVLREQFLTTSFTRFLSRPVAERIIREGGRLPDPRRKRVSVLFADLRGFTAYSEVRDPEEISRALNLHFSEIIDKVFKHGGTLDKLLGDCVMAFWGDPEDHPDSPLKAVRCAADIRKDWDRLAPIHFGSAAGQVGIGLGIESGVAVVGNIGTSDFLDYTVVGDIVNVASRLCDVAKAGQILIGPGMADQVRSATQLSPGGSVKVRGRESEVEIWEVG